jgi:hypothetical protein
VALDARARGRAALTVHGALPAGSPEVGALADGDSVPAGPLVLSEPVAIAVAAEVDRAVLTSATVPLAEVRPRIARLLRRHADVEPAAADAAASALVDLLVGRGRIGRSGSTLHAPGKPPGIPPGLEVAMDLLEAALDVPMPPTLSAAASAAGCPPDGIRRLEAAGRIVCVDDDLAWASATFGRLVEMAVRLATPGPLKPAALRDATHTNRRCVMALLDELGRRGVLVRTPDGHMRGPRA